MPLFPDNAAADHAFFCPCGHDFSLLASRKDLPNAKSQEHGPPLVPPYWPPLGWESLEIPRDDSEIAIFQWFDFYLHPVGPLRCRESLDREKGKPVDWSRCVRDAWRLARHLNAIGKSKMEIGEQSGCYDAHEALIELESIRRCLLPTSMPRPDNAALPKTAPCLNALTGPSIPPCPILLHSEGEMAVAFNKDRLPPLFKGITYHAVKALIAAYPTRLSGNELNKKTNATDARASLSDLCEAYPAWKELIDFPSCKNGYAIKRVSVPPPGFPASPGSSPV